ncbi:MAG TPA: hypothetical protein VKQ29_14565 [Aliidongia sp.]|nr:hypothetical protein [Aliidongia sp.]
MRMSHLLAACGAMAVAAGAFLIFATMPVRLPAPSGRFAVASRPLELPVANGAIATPIAEIWYPTDPTSDHGTDGAAPPPLTGRPLPVLFYLPSWGGTALEDMFLIRDLVSHGFVVTSLRYPSPSEIAASAAKGVPLRPEEAGAMDFSSKQAFENTWQLGSEKVRTRAQNVVAVLDRLERLNEEPSSAFAHRLDLDRVGAWGFSLGGAAAAQAAWLDRRIKAVANLDGWLFGDAATDGVPCPYFLIGDDTPLPGPTELNSPNAGTRYTATFELQDYDRQIAGMKRYGGLAMTIDGTNHINFSDEAARSRFHRLTGAGPIDAGRAFVIVADYLRSFFEARLLGQPSPLLDGDSPVHPEAHLQVFGRSDVHS